jgi:hypothetical protein
MISLLASLGHMQERFPQLAHLLPLKRSTTVIKIHRGKRNGLKIDYRNYFNRFKDIRGKCGRAKKTWSWTLVLGSPQSVGGVHSPYHILLI